MARMPFPHTCIHVKCCSLLSPQKDNKKKAKPNKSFFFYSHFPSEQGDQTPCNVFLGNGKSEAKHSLAAVTGGVLADVAFQQLPPQALLRQRWEAAPCPVCPSGKLNNGSGSKIWKWDLERINRYSVLENGSRTFIWV